MNSVEKVADKIYSTIAVTLNCPARQEEGKLRS